MIRVRPLSEKANKSQSLKYDKHSINKILSKVENSRSSFRKRRSELSDSINTRHFEDAEKK